MGASIAIVPSFTPARVQVASGLLARDEDNEEEEEEEEEEGEMRNTGPVHFLAAVERAWYFERGINTPLDGWTEGDRAFDYRLQDGVWELEDVPGYDENVRTR
jgi:hypothetical protein